MATLVRFREPYRDLAALHTEMSRLMSGFGDGPGQTNESWAPAVDVWETEKEIVYAFDLPGVPENKISLEYEENALTLNAERERTQEVSNDRLYRFERRFGTFSRTIGLPQGVSEDGIRAEYHNGVLEVHVAKPEQPKPRRIQVSSNGSQQPVTIEGSASQS